MTVREGFLVPDIDEPAARDFWAGCSQEELRVQGCAHCRRRRMPPRPMCPHCRSLQARWEVMSGRGHIWSFVVPHPPLLPAYAAEAPYNVVVVELDDDPTIRMVGNVVTGAGAALDAVDPSTVDIGQAVQVVFTEIAVGVWLPQWVRV